MKENYEELETGERPREDVFSKSVRAGRRTYFFDVKATRGNDYYLTITESKRNTERDGKFVYEKHKIFLYKEDFEKFMQGLNEVIAYIDSNNSGGGGASSEATSETYKELQFEDLPN